jgi:hypothetical protein
MAMWLLLAAGRRRLLATPGPWLGVLAACAAFSPVVVHNVRQPLETFQEVGASANLVTRPGVGQWLATAPRAAAQLGRSFVGGWDVAGVPAGGPGPWLTLAAVLAVVGFVVLAARWHTPETPGRRLPLVAVVASATILPLVNGNWEGFLEARYLGFLAPLAAAAAGAVVSEVVHRPGWRRSVAAAAAGFLVVVPAVAVPRDIRAAEAAGRDNRALFAVVAAAREAAGAGSAVWLASDLKELPWQGRGDPRRATAYYLTLSHVPFDVAPTDKLRYFVDQGTPIVFVASADLAAHLARAGRVTPVALSRVAGFPEWGLYRSP